MLKNRLITYILLFLFFSKIIYAQEDSKKNFIVGKILFEGLKVTKTKYLLSAIGIKEGSTWNTDVKSKLYDTLSKMTDIIESVEISEEFLTNNIVDVKINIIEKGSYLIVPFFKYSSSSGLQPKFIFRHYNLGGYRKYLNTKFDFIPTDSLDFSTLYKDPAVANNDWLSYSLTGTFSTSVINYYANLNPDGSPRGILPIGVIGGDPNANWNSDHELFYEGSFEYNLTYKIPNSAIDPTDDIEINPRLNFDFTSIRAYRGDYKGPQDSITPVFNLNLRFPIKDTKTYIKPSFTLAYELDLGIPSLPQNAGQYYTAGRDILTNKARLGFDIWISKIDARVSPFIELDYEKTSNYEFLSDGSLKINNHSEYIVLPDGRRRYIYLNSLPAHALDLIIGSDFKKGFITENVSHYFDISIQYTQRLVGGKGINKIYNPKANHDNYQIYKELEHKEYYFYFDSLFNFTYEFDMRIMEMHHFKMRWNFFVAYNKDIGYDGFEIGNKPGELDGWIGLVGYLKYELPLFLVNTTKFVSVKMKRLMLWQVYWDFMIDIGLINSDQKDYGQEFSKVITYNFLNLRPVFAAGTAIRVAPKFIPIEISLTAGFDIYAIIKTGDFSGNTFNLIFEIGDKF